MAFITHSADIRQILDHMFERPIRFIRMGDIGLVEQAQAGSVPGQILGAIDRAFQATVYLAQTQAVSSISEKDGTV